MMTPPGVPPAKTGLTPGLREGKGSDGRRGLECSLRPRITLGAISSKVMTSVTRNPDLGLLVLGV